MLLLSEGIFDNLLYFGPDMFQGEDIMSLIVMGIIIILSIITYFVFRKLDPTKPEKGFALVMVMIVEKLDGMVKDLMGKKYKGFGGYVLALVLYIGLGFFVGLVGFPSPLSHMQNAFSIGLCTFALIHATAAKANKWGYFHRYIEPVPFLLPINLLSMWAPLLSISLRIFGNAVSGMTLMGIIYWGLNNLGNLLFGWINVPWLSGNVLIPIIAPVMHAYFDVFSGFVQTLIFIMLTMIQVAQEDPDPELEA